MQMRLQWFGLSKFRACALLHTKRKQNNMADRKRVRKKTVSESGTKRRKLEWSRQHRRISLGIELERWNAAKVEIEAASDAELAKTLLDSWYSNKQTARIQNPVLEAASSTPVGSGAVFSTPAVPGSKLVVPDISDIEGSVKSSCEISGVEELSTDSEEPTHKSLLTRYEEKAAKAESSFIRFSFSEDDEALRNDDTYSPAESDIDDDCDDDLEFEMSLCNGDELYSHLETQVMADDLLDFDIPNEEEGEEKEEEEEEEDIEDLSGDEVDVVQEKKSICYESSLKKLAHLRIPTVCQKKNCDGKISISFRYVGSAVQLVWICTGGHTVYTWNSQPKIKRMFSGNLLMSAVILISGNNFQKISLMAKFLNLGMISSTTHHRIQRLFTAPVINSSYQQMMMAILQRHRGKEIIIAGDGRNDSPGHSAMYCTYSFMEYETKDIISSVIIDKRMTQLNSTAMEKEGFIRALQYLLENDIDVKEVCTDAHPQITALLRERYPQICHSYDTWHGAKNIGKKINAVASENRNKMLRPWASDIINHFWYCSRKAEGSEMALIARWRGILHHTTNVHEWVSGDGAGPAACEHDPIDQEEHEDKWLEPGSDAHSALGKLVLDTRLLHKMKFFVNFRHTGELESFHEQILMYAAKRFAYVFPMYRARNQLAVLDYQHHKDRQAVATKEGETRYVRKYSKRSKNWTAVAVKERKNYNYIPGLLSEVVRALKEHQGPLPKRFPLEEDDPRCIRKTIAAVSPESTKVLVERKLSRFQDQ